MKQYIRLITLFFCVAIGSACSKVLKTQPYDKISEDVIWSNKANAETFIFGTYPLTLGEGNLNGYNEDEYGGTDLYTTNLIRMEDWYDGVQQTYTEKTDRHSDFGFNNWNEVRRCNLIIQNIGNSNGVADADKTSLIAEAKFLRAISYFKVARKVGRICWIDRVLKPSDSLNLPATLNPEESYRHIIKDLEDAVAGMPDKKIPGRANKFVAAAYLTEVCLACLAYKNYPQPPDINPNDSLLQKIIDNANIVINEGGYSLEPDYGGMFNETKNTSPEIIYAIYQKSVDSTPIQFMVPYIQQSVIDAGGGSPYFTVPDALVGLGNNFPTQNFTDNYLTIDDDNTNVALPWDETSQYRAAVDETVTVPGTVDGSQRAAAPDEIPHIKGETVIRQGRVRQSSKETLWTLANKGRDARWSASVVSDSSAPFLGQILTTCIRGNANRLLKDVYGAGGTGWFISSTNMYWRKDVYTNAHPRIYTYISEAYHYVMMRLGRVYLNLSEAYLLKGDVANAVACLNKTRVVHGKLPPSTAIAIADAWKDYKRERRVDLAMENDFYYSLLRWGRYGGAANDGNTAGGTIRGLTEPVTVMDVSKDRKSFRTITGSLNAQSYNARSFDPSKRYLFPITQSLIDNNPNFGPQNNGW